MKKYRNDFTGPILKTPGTGAHPRKGGVGVGHRRHGRGRNGSVTPANGARPIDRGQSDVASLVFYLCIGCLHPET